jgi:hypothetical protein
MTVLQPASLPCEVALPELLLSVAFDFPTGFAIDHGISSHMASIVITDSSGPTLDTRTEADPLLLAGRLLAWFARTSVHISPKAREGNRIKTKQRCCI